MNWKDLSIDDPMLDLTDRLRKGLKSQGILTLGLADAQRDNYLLSIKGLGHYSIAELRRVIEILKMKAAANGTTATTEPVIEAPETPRLPQTRTLRTVCVRFQPTESYGTQGRTYSYLWDGPEEIHAGDLAVVESPSSGYQVVLVDEVKEDIDPRATKHIIDRIDVARFARREAAAQRRKELEMALELEVKKLDRSQRYEQLAKTNPKARDMLNELRSLDQ